MPSPPIGTIARVDQHSGEIVTIEVALADLEDVASVSQTWAAESGHGGSAGALFNWRAIHGFWPERHVLFANWQGTTFGLVQIDDDFPPLRTRAADQRAVYISFLEIAPLLRSRTRPRRFVGLGAALLTFAVARSRQLGYGGRVGLHSILQAREFYAKLGFLESTEPGSNEYWESYLELSPSAADRFIEQSKEN